MQNVYAELSNTDQSDYGNAAQGTASQNLELTVGDVLFYLVL